MLFVTLYEVIGSRCTGSYLVNAPTKREANKIVKAFDSDYCRIHSVNQRAAEFHFSMSWDDIIEDVPIPNEGQASHIESGT